MADHPSPDKQQLAAFWQALVQPGTVHEVRLLGVRKKGPLKWFGRERASFFDNKDAFVRELSQVSGLDAAGAYITLNPVKRDLLARSANELEEVTFDLTKDHNVTRRTAILIDADPKRESGISATEEELEAALGVRDQVIAYLANRGFPDPLAVGMSGNGGHILFRVDLPNDEEVKTLVENFLKGLHVRFETAGVKIDCGVFNAGRLTKIFGSVAAKGRSIPERPWRIARGEFNQGAQTLPRDLLEAVAAEAPQPEGPDRSSGSADGPSRSWSVSDILSWNGIGFKTKQGGSETVYLLDRCLASDDHSDGAAITEQSNGRLGYRCHHDRCRSQGWHDIKGELGIDEWRVQHEPRIQRNRHSANSANTATGGSRSESAHSEHHATHGFHNESGSDWSQTSDDAGDAHSGESIEEGTAQNSQNAHNDGDWEPPTPFADTSVPPFPLDALPKRLRDFVISLSISTQTPPDLAALMSLGSVAAAVAKKVRVFPRAGYSEPLNIFAAVALSSGNRKSAVVAEVTAPILAYQAERELALREIIAEAQSRRRVKEAALGRAEKAAASDPDGRGQHEAEAAELARELARLGVPVVPRLVVDDCTPERLGSLMCEQGGRMAVMSAEGGLFDLIAGRYSATGAPNLDIILKGHAGDFWAADRISRAAEFIESPALTIALAVQPTVLEGLAARPEFRGRGLIGRFLYALPASTLGRRQIAPPPVSSWARCEFSRMIRQLLDLPFGTDPEGKPVPYALRATEEARELFDQFDSWLEPQLGDFGILGHMTDWAGKLVGAVARVSGLLHLVRYADEDQPWDRPIERATMAQAIRIGQYLLRHAIVVYGLLGADPAIEDAKYIWRWIEHRSAETLTKRDIFEGTKGRFKKVEAMGRGLGFLIEHGYLREQTVERIAGPGRKPSPIYEVNPLAPSQAVHTAQQPGPIPDFDIPEEVWDEEREAAPSARRTVVL